MLHAVSDDVCVMFAGHVGPGAEQKGSRDGCEDEWHPLFTCKRLISCQHLILPQGSLIPWLYSSIVRYILLNTASTPPAAKGRHGAMPVAALHAS